MTKMRIPYDKFLYVGVAAIGGAVLMLNTGCISPTAAGTLVRNFEQTPEGVEAMARPLPAVERRYGSLEGISLATYSLQIEDSPSCVALFKDKSHFHEDYTGGFSFYHNEGRRQSHSSPLPSKNERYANSVIMENAAKIVKNAGLAYSYMHVKKKKTPPQLAGVFEIVVGYNKDNEGTLKQFAKSMDSGLCEFNPDW
ncbi:MAG TPA: hypothetical protein VI979_04345 [archaeon]|nr:hypothetical protein [archaeon]